MAFFVLIASFVLLALSPLGLAARWIVALKGRVDTLTTQVERSVSQIGALEHRMQGVFSRLNAINTLYAEQTSQSSVSPVPSLQVAPTANPPHVEPTPVKSRYELLLEGSLDGNGPENRDE
jgi:hypothetical protein